MRLPDTSIALSGHRWCFDRVAFILFPGNRHEHSSQIDTPGDQRLLYLLND